MTLTWLFVDVRVRQSNYAEVLIGGSRSGGFQIQR